MSAEPSRARPSPAMMPRRRPVIPPAQRAPRRSTFRAADGIPRRGWPDAIVWPDTGILLVLGTDGQLLRRFRGRYGGKIRVADVVDREIRGLSEGVPGPDAPDTEYDRIAAATHAVRELLLGARSLPVVRLREQDLEEVAHVTEQLRALSDDKNKKHGGEAQIIVLAARTASEQGCRQVLLTNDGGASVVAHQHGIPARHAADVIAELACADASLTPEMCLAVFRASVPISAPPAHCRPTDAAAFTCRATSSGCAACDSTEHTL